MTSTQKFGAMLDIVLNRKFTHKLMRITFLLPRVSAIKPHKCDVVKTPRTVMEDSNPFWNKFKPKSHLAAGIINIISIVSIITHIKDPPAASKTYKLNKPKPKNNNKCKVFYS